MYLLYDEQKKEEIKEEKKKDFLSDLFFSHEMGATELVIAPQSPPVNAHAHKQVAGDFPMKCNLC